MGLSILQSSEKHEVKSESQKLLETYVQGATKSIGYVYRSEARKKAGEYAKDFYCSDEAKTLTKTDVKAMEKQLNRELKQYGWKERLDYHLNGRAQQEEAGSKEDPDILDVMKAMRGVLAVGAVGIAVSTAKLLNHQIQDPAVVASFLAIATKGVVMMGNTIINDNREQAVEKYTDLKHSQLALKKLKREIKKAGRSGKDALKEQPNAGLIQAARLKNQGR